MTYVTESASPHSPWLLYSVPDFDKFTSIVWQLSAQYASVVSVYYTTGAEKDFSQLSSQSLLTILYHKSKFHVLLINLQESAQYFSDSVEYDNLPVQSAHKSFAFESAYL